MKHLLQNHFRLLILAIAPISLTACGSDDRGSYNCTANVAQSVVLNVSETTGQPIDEYLVSYRINNGAVQNVLCKAESNCLGVYEASGEFAITILKDGFESTSINVTVTRNVCHVNTQTLTITLKSLT
jgi:hypothetical protein